MDNSVAAHRSHNSHSSHSSHTSGSSHRSHSSHTSGTTPQSHTSHSSHYSATIPVRRPTQNVSTPERETDSANSILEQKTISTDVQSQNLQITSQTLEQEYAALHASQQQTLVATTLRTGGMFLSPLILLRTKVQASTAKETAFLAELNAAIAAVMERRHFHATAPTQGAQWWTEKAKFCDIQKDWDVYLEKAVQTVFERNKIVYTNLLDRAIQAGNTNLAVRISQTLIPRGTPPKTVTE